MPSFPDLIGSAFEGGWFQTQKRYLQAFKDLFLRESSKKWYYFCDDDTYTFPNGLLNFLSEFSSENLVGIGSLFSTSSRDLRIISGSTNKAFFFPMGGAGIVFSQSFAKDLLKEQSNLSNQSILDHCYEMIQVPLVPADTRLGYCINKFYGNIKMFYWDQHHLRGIHPLDLPSKTPFFKRYLNYTHEQSFPITYHHIELDHFSYLWNSHISSWKSLNGSEFFMDFGQVSTSLFYLGNHLLRWGYSIDNSFPKTGLIPVFDKNDTEKVNPHEFWQYYENDLKMHIICSKNMRYREMTAQEIGENGYIESLVFCNKPQQFLVTNPGIGSPTSVTQIYYPIL